MYDYILLMEANQMNALTVDTLISEVKETLSRQPSSFRIDAKTFQCIKALEACTDINSALDFFTGVGDCLGDVGVYMRTPYAITHNGFKQTNAAEFIIQSSDNLISVQTSVGLVRRQLRQEIDSYGFDPESAINVICINSAVEALNAMEYDLDTVLNM